ncbi:hypothetical protein JTE90_007711, partial [Oedothorax gibbosus]
MAVDYKELVLQLLHQKKYPVLQEFVVVDIHYKMIPSEAPCQTIRSFDRRLHDPQHVWQQHMDPSRISYLVDNPPLFHIHETEHLDTTSLPFDCQRIKLSRGYIDAIRNEASLTFEEELYHFLTLLNFDVPALAPFIDTSFVDCTRLLPQCIRLWTYKYEERPLDHIPVDTRLADCFGPPTTEGVLPIRVLRGKLAPCTSQSTLLSLNNDHEAHLSG